MMFFAIFVLIRTRFCVSVERERDRNDDSKEKWFICENDYHQSKQASEWVREVMQWVWWRKTAAACFTTSFITLTLPLYISFSVTLALSSSVIRLGYFWKVLVAKFLVKVVQIFDDFLRYFENHILYVNVAVATKWDNLWKKLGYFLFQHHVTLLSSVFLP